MIDRVVKSKLALKGMTLKDLSEEIKESYSSVHEVIHGKWGDNGKVATRILNKISHYLDLPELSREESDESI